MLQSSSPGSCSGPLSSPNSVLCAEYGSSSDYTYDSEGVEMDSGPDIATVEEEPETPEAMARAHCQTLLESLENELLSVGS